MEALEHYLLQLFYFFQNNLIAAGVLIVVIIIAAVKKPKELFKVVALLVFLVAVLYTMVFIEKSMFSGVSSKERGIDIEGKMK